MTEPVVVQLTPTPFACIRRKATLADMPTVMAEGFAALSQLFDKAHARMAGAPLAHYLDYDATSATFELGFPVDAEKLEDLRAAGLTIGQTPGGDIMTATHIGPYDTIVRTYDAMTMAMKQRGLSGSKDMWERYFSPPDTPPEQIRTDVLWPVSKAP